MSGATHTPGPWVVAGKATINSAKGGWIASVSTFDRAANAALIAAAPDMLQAAERVLKWVEPIAGDNRDEAAATEEIESVAELRAAISRAREHKEAKP